MYTSYTDYTEDLLCYLDMSLSEVMEKKKHGKRVLPGVVSYEKTAQDDAGKDARETITKKRKQIIQRTNETRENGETELLWFDNFCRRFAFDDWQKFLFLICIANHIDRSYERAYAYLQDDARAVFPTLGLAWYLYQYLYMGNEKVVKIPRCLLPDGFLEEDGQDAERLSGLAAPLKLQPELLRYLGMPVQKENYAFRVYDAETDIAAYEESEVGYLEKILFGWKEELGEWDVRDICFIRINGEAGVGKKTLVKAACDRVGVQMYLLKTVDLQEKDKDTLLQAALAAKLAGALLCVEIDGQEKDELRIVRYMARWLRHFAVLSAAETCGYVPDGAKRLDLHLVAPDAAQREVIWRRAFEKLNVRTDSDLARIADNNPLLPGQIWEVTAQLSENMRLIGLASVNEAQIRTAIDHYVPDLLGGSASRINAAYTWDDIIIDDRVKRVLKNACDRYRLRRTVEEQHKWMKVLPYGKGVTLMLSGASGTGKTMAVQVIANELGLDLYKVDISRLVSKYIGETEKNISELFEKAKKTNALLFFDEADALFAKRTKADSVHDRNANMESAHLLQKIEEHEGFVVLATNFPGNIDTAFMRRMKYYVSFYEPDQEMRELLWRKLAADNQRMDEDCDLSFYAKKLKVTGSAIKEIYTNALYLAVAADEPLGDKQIREAAEMYSMKVGYHFL